jgi:hypothetical protein
MDRYQPLAIPAQSALVYLLRHLQVPVFRLLESVSPGFLREPVQAFQMSAIGTPQRPSTVARGDRLAVFDLARPQ